MQLSSTLKTHAELINADGEDVDGGEGAGGKPRGRGRGRGRARKGTGGRAPQAAGIAPAEAMVRTNRGRALTGVGAGLVGGRMAAFTNQMHANIDGRLQFLGGKAAKQAAEQAERKSPKVKKARRNGSPTKLAGLADAVDDGEGHGHTGRFLPFRTNALKRSPSHDKGSRSSPMPSRTRSC